ncbi:MAG: hypothetical protein ACREEZ_01315, partial [Stellaceae bacterium]
MARTELATRDAAAGSETTSTETIGTEAIGPAAIERTAAPFALARVFGRPHGEPAGEVALFREPRPGWRPAAGQHRIPYAWISFVLVVMLPVAVAATYYFCIAADQYVAEFRFGLRSAEQARAAPGGLLQPGISTLQIGLDSYAV